MNIRPFTRGAFRIPDTGTARPVIEVVPGRIVTRKRMERVSSRNGNVAADTARDILKLAV